ncbi:MAG: hypothetical protein KatS3mg110_3013 [Pirellulaceae bacterium]|nr:MAG: hypothetical protein KatS3mg110_3013 [Pirellulaceae bacterium]
MALSGPGASLSCTGSPGFSPSFHNRARTAARMHQPAPQSSTDTLYLIEGCFHLPKAPKLLWGGLTV